MAPAGYTHCAGDNGGCCSCFCGWGFSPLSDCAIVSNERDSGREEEIREKSANRIYSGGGVREIGSVFGPSDGL